MKTENTYIINGFVGIWGIIDTREVAGHELWLLEQKAYNADKWHEVGPTKIITSYRAEKVIVDDATNGWDELPNHYEIELKINGYLPAKSYPGGYPLIYIMDEGSVVCAKCASEYTNRIDTCAPYYEGTTIECDGGCGTHIESAYGDPDAEESEETV